MAVRVRVPFALQNMALSSNGLGYPALYWVMTVRVRSGLLNLTNMNNAIIALSLLISVPILLCIDTCKEDSTSSNVIYNQLSNDNWGTSTDRDSIDEEYKVVLTKESLTITELVPGSAFFKNFVKDTTIKTITLSFERGKFKSTEYWANVAEAPQRLTLFHYTEVYCVFVQGHSGMIRMVIRPREGRDENFCFWPAKENR